MQLELTPWLDFQRQQAIRSHKSEFQELPLAGIAHTGIDLCSCSPRFALLISRLPRRIMAEDIWLKRLREAVQEVAARGGSIICGEGSFGWDYTAWFASRVGVPLIMALTPGNPSRFLERLRAVCHRLDSDVDRIQAFMPIIDGESTAEQKLRLRDRLVYELAQHRLPIALRRGSGWFRLFEGDEDVDERFLSPYLPRKSGSWPIIGREFPERLIRDRLFHWTRGVFGPWQGETDADYFRDLTASSSGNPRDGLATLTRIVFEAKLRGEARMNRSGAPSISLTSLGPAATAHRARYRPTLGHWNFEPYGLSLPVETFKSLGARPVIYGSSEDFSMLPPPDRPFFQFKGRGDSTDWTEEREWRLMGDLELSGLLGNLVLWVPNSSEAALLERLTGIESVALSN